MHRRLALCTLLGLALSPPAAHAWMVGTPFYDTGCHEPITAAALRAVRARFDTAQPVAPSRDEAAMIADVEFLPPADFVHDLAGMTLLLGVRDNDLKGIDPLSSLDLFHVQGDPQTQGEHCNRGPDDDGDTGDERALAACRDFIANAATEALDGLDAAGRVDPTRRMSFKLFLAIRGEITLSLPVFYLKIGEAMHTLEDSFPHSYRTADGMRVTAVLNGIEMARRDYDEARDGPRHRGELDRCWDDSDPIIHRNYELSIQAAADLLAAALDPALGREQKIAQFGAVTRKYLSYQPGCTFANHWCDAPEAQVTNALTCNASGNRALAPWSALVLAGLIVRRRRHRARGVAIGCAAIVTAGLAFAARAEPPASPVSVRTDTATPSAPVNAGAAAGSTAMVPTIDNGSGPSAVMAPTPEQPTESRATQPLGSRWGFMVSAGGSIDRGAVVASLGGRYRLCESWLIGLDASWNPWITSSPRQVHAGVAIVAGTAIWRPLRSGRFTLRSSLHLGASALLFDVYGAPKYSTGLYGALSVLGLEVDLGHATRIVFDPMEMALPIPVLAGPPLYYEQFRMVFGLQIGA